MAKSDRIDEILRSWPYDPSALGVRLVKARDRNVIQMRVDLGVLQLETGGRPDGLRIDGEETYLHHMLKRLFKEGEDFQLGEEDFAQVDREFIQFYHRRICWLKLRNYESAVRDADHSLHMMDFCRDHSPDTQWTATHEQYRPFVLFHRIQAAALAAVDEHGADAGVELLDAGSVELRLLFRQRGEEDGAEERELLERLDELRSTLVDQFDPRQRLQIELERAIAAERYEEAARIRDELAQMDVR